MTYDYVIGMDVGKYFHHACVLDIDGTQVLSKRINQNEKSLRALFSTFSAHDHKVLVVVDQPNNIGRLTVAVAQDLGIDVRYLPGRLYHRPRCKEPSGIPPQRRPCRRSFPPVEGPQRYRRRLSALLHQAHQSDSKCTSWLLPAIRTSSSRPDNPPQVGSAPTCTLRRTDQDKTPRKSQSSCLCSTL